VDLNIYLVNKFVEVFGKTDHIESGDPTHDLIIPIVPTFGNNDILPHNIFEPGPNKWTRKYADVWNRFIPEEQRHSFARGGWFFVEVIPNRLAVFSINTLYFFDSNSAVDGCDAESEPGYEHMEWLRIQLQFLRERGMKAILTGHVPPARTESKQSWDETCWQKWTLWMRMYRDVVVGSVFGHMNIDHFMIQDVKKLTYKFEVDGVELDDELEEEEEISTGRNSTLRVHHDDFSTAAKKNTYLNELRSGWSDLPAPPRGRSYSNIDNGDIDFSKKKKKSQKQLEEKFLKEIGGQWAERFSLALVSPSVVPNYFPSLRVVEYNISGLEGESPVVIQRPKRRAVFGKESSGPESQLWSETNDGREGDISMQPDDEIDDADLHDLKKSKKKVKKPKPNFPVPDPPSSTAPPGPAYSMQTFTLLGYTQYFANLTHINEDAEKKGEKATVVEYKIEYDTRHDNKTIHDYALSDLTVRAWLGLAQRIGRDNLENELPDVDGHKDVLGLGMYEVKAKNHLWHTFIRRAFVGTKPDEQLENDFW